MWEDDCIYYDANGPITNESKLDTIKKVLEKLGKRAKYRSTYTANDGVNFKNKT